MARSSFDIRLFNIVEPVTTFYGDLIPHWTGLGRRVEVIMSRAKYRAGREITWLGDNVSPVLSPCFGLKPGGLLSRAVILPLYALTAALRSLLGPGTKLNLFLTQPPLFFVWGWVLKKLRKQPYVIVSMDLYPDVAAAAGMIDGQSFLARLLTRLSRFGLRRADRVVAIGRRMRERLEAAGVPARHIELIPNWADVTAVVPVAHEENPFHREMGWQDKFVVLYSGNMGVSHYFDDILRVALELRGRADLVFAFIGRGKRHKEIASFKARHDLDNIVLLPFMERDRLSLGLGAGDLHFVSLREGFAGLVVPSKAYGVMAAGRPILYQGEAEGEIARLVEAHDIGTTVPLNDPDRLRRAILDYVDNPREARRQGACGRRLAEEKYDSASARQAYTRLIQTEFL